MPDTVMKYLYDSLIKPYFLYGIEIWHASASYNRDKLFKVQKRAIRTICNLPMNSHTSDRFKQLSILKLGDVFNYQIYLRLFKAIHYDIDADLFNQLLVHSDVHSYSTRFRSNLLTPVFHKAKSQSCIFYVAPNSWNSLPERIKQIESLYKFKKCLIQHFTSKY